MKIYRLLLLMLLCVLSEHGFAQTHTFCAADSNCTLTGNNTALAGQNQFNFYSGNGAIVVDGVKYAGAQALQSAIQACAPPSCVVDALNPTIGAQTFTTNPTAGFDFPITIWAGPYTISYDPTSFLLLLPSGSSFIGNGTTLKSSRTDGLGTSTSPYQWAGLITSELWSTTGSITSGQKTLTVASTTHAAVGDMVIVYGAVGGMTGSGNFGTQSTTVNQGGGMLVGDTSVIATATAGFGTDPRSQYLLVDSEIMSFSAFDATHFTGLTRGLFGTSAATHSNGATIYQLASLVTFISSISGSVLTLQDAASFTVSNSTVRIGAKNISIGGNLTLDCGYTDKSQSVSNPCVGVGLTGSRFVDVAPSVTIQNALDGVSMTASWNNHISGVYRWLGRPPNSLGWDVVCFEQCNYNRFDTVSHENGDLCFGIDDRSTNATIYSGNSNSNVAYLGPCGINGAPATNGVVIEGGSSNNAVYAGYVNTGNVGGTGGIIIDSAQWTGTQPAPKNNTIYFGTVNSPSQQALETFGYTSGTNTIMGGQVTAGGSGTIAPGDRFLTTSNGFSQLYSLQMTRSGGAAGFADISGDGTHALVIGDANGSKLEHVVADTGLQLFNTTTTCTTAASVGATCTTAAITLPASEADTSYRISCTGKGLTNVPTVIATTNSSATQFTITVAALTAAAASFASYDCIAGHN